MLKISCFIRFFCAVHEIGYKYCTDCNLFVNGLDYMTISSFSAFSFTASKRQKYVLLTVKQTPHESCWDAGDSVVHSILGFTSDCSYSH